MKIKTKLLSSFIGLVIGCELMTATPLLFSTFKRIKNHILEITQLKIEQINSQVLSFLKPPVDAINATINFLDFCDMNDKEKIELYMKHTAQAQSDFTMFYVTSMTSLVDGGYMHSNNSWQPPEGFDQTTRPWFTNAQRTSAVCFSQPYLDAGTTGGIVTTISRRFEHDGKLEGILGLDFSIGILNELVNETKLTPTGMSFLIDSQGYYITNPDSKKIAQENFWKDYGFEKYAGRISENETFIQLYDHGKYFAAKTMPLSCGWTLVTTGETAEIYSSLVTNGIVLFSTVAFTLIAAIGTGIFLAMRIIKPVHQVGKRLNEIASGTADLTKRIEVHSHDEVGAVSKGFNIFVEKLHEIIRLISGSKNNLIEAGKKLVSEAEESSCSITQIIANINSINAQIKAQGSSVHETVGAVNQIASNIEALEKMIGSQAVSVTQASAAVEEMIGNIASVNSSVEKMASSFESLQEDAQKGAKLQKDVNEKITQIDNESRTLQEANAAVSSIAAQTNLLAMNAAIEAAHAGEAGKGFSVVADEIRKLSETSAAQSKHIGQQLTLIQNSIAAVVEASTESSKAFESVSSKIKNTDELVHQIKYAMDEQHTGSQQITNSLSAMNDSTAEVKTASSEMAMGNRQILQEIRNLQDSTTQINRSMDEISGGARRINETSISLNEVSNQMSQAINDIGKEIDQFKI